MSNGSKHHRQPQEQYDLDVLLQQAIKSRAHSLKLSEEMPHAKSDDINSHRRGPLGRAWARLGWEREFGLWRRWWLRLASRQGAKVFEPRWAVAQALAALVLPGALLYLLLLSQFDITQIVMAVQIGLSVVVGRGW